MDTRLGDFVESQIRQDYSQASSLNVHSD